MSGILNLLLGSAAGVIKDAYFNLVTLLLNTTATNGAQNNTFLDSSTNNFSITRNGNTTQGTFTPFSQTGWGNYFNGSADYLVTNSSTALNLGANDFTAECWFYTTSTASTQTIISGVNATLGTGSWILQINNTGQLRFYCNYNGGTALDYNVGTGTVSTNTWNHFAATRSGANLRIFLNGTQVGTTNTSLAALSIDNASGNYTIGQVTEIRSGWYFNGYISNLRVVIGTALYTSNFTPSTTPLTAVTNTKLLTCQSNRFLDNSTNALTFTVGGTPSVQAFSPFAPTAAYDTAVVGGSGYFDGNGDYLTVPDTTSLEPATGDFCFETWVYHTRASNGSSFDTYTFQTSGGLFVYRTLSNKIQVDSDGVVAILTSASNVPFNSWAHIAVTRSGTTLRIFINGVVDASVTNSTNIAGSGNISYGGRSVGSILEGYLSSTRFVKGSAVYTATFTPPTAPLTAITNTQILLNYTNAGIYDSAAKNDLETVGNAQVSTTQAKFGTTSMYFDGSGDWLTAANGKNFINLTEPFTFECWVYVTGTPNYWSICGGGSGTFLLTIQSLTVININPYGSGNTLSVTTSLSTNTWIHIAATRNSSNRFDIWVNGVSAGNTTSTQSFGSPTYFVIGAADSGGTQSFNGYLDEVRITKGYARYTATFTPPAAAFPIQ
jgi:hypothetical protein